MFTRYTRVLHLQVAGETIRTTGEHPFWSDRSERGLGWAKASELVPGDRLLTATGEWLTIDAVEETADDEVVYNCRVAEWHTYFVGDDGWGWSVWAHNQYLYRGDTGPYYPQLLGEGRKPFIDQNGDLNPASLTGIDPNGRPVSQYDHELGAYWPARKSHSPFTSFSHSKDKAENWGAYIIVINYDLIRHAVESGTLPGVSIYETTELITLFLTESATNFRTRAVNFATEAEEVMIRGVIPKEYIVKIYKQRYRK